MDHVRALARALGARLKHNQFVPVIALTCLDRPASHEHVASGV